MLTMLVCFLLAPSNVYADEINFAVSPSKIVNMVIKPGTTETIKFKVGNRSIFPSHQTEKNELYEIAVTVEAEMTRADGSKIDTKNIVKISDTLLKAKPNKNAAETTVDIKIPKDFTEDSYRLDIIFTRKPIAGIEDQSSASAVTSIKVPVYLGVGDPKEYSELKTDYEIEDLNIDFGEENTVLKYSLKNLKELLTLNPVKVVNVFSGIKEKDVYVVNKNGKISVDVLSGINTTLKDVVTYTGKTSDTKYVKMNEEDNNKEVSNVYFEDRLVNFVLADGTSIEVECHNKVRDNIRAQINTLIKEQNLTKPRMRFFLDNLLVPSNKKFNILDYNASIKVKNTGEKENFVNAKVTLKKDATYEMGGKSLELLTIMKGEISEITLPLDITSEITSGAYALTAEFIDVNNNIKSKVFNFNIDLNIDKAIFWTTLGLYVLILAIIGLVIYLIIKNYKDKVLVGYVNVPSASVEYLDDNYAIFMKILDFNGKSDPKGEAIVINNLSIKAEPFKSQEDIKVLEHGATVKVTKVNIISDDTVWIKVKCRKQNDSESQEEA